MAKSTSVTSVPLRQRSSGLETLPNFPTRPGSVVRRKYGWLLAMKGEKTAKKATVSTQSRPRRAPVRPTVSSMTCTSQGCGARSDSIAGRPAGKSGEGCAAMAVTVVLVVGNARVGDGVKQVADQQADDG